MCGKAMPCRECTSILRLRRRKGAAPDFNKARSRKGGAIPHIRRQSRERALEAHSLMVGQCPRLMRAVLVQTTDDRSHQPPAENTNCCRTLGSVCDKGR